MIPASGAIVFDELLDAADRLPRPVVVLDECEPDVPVSGGAESDARTHRDESLLKQQLREFERPDAAEGLGNRSPDEHGRLGFGDGPAGGGQAVAEQVAAPLVEVADFMDVV